MEDKAWHVITAILTGGFAIAIVAVMLAPKSQTTGVFQSFFGGLGSLITAAEGPVMGGGGMSGSYTNGYTGGGVLL